MGLGLDDLKSIILSGFKSAFLPFHVKQQMLRKASEELRAFTVDTPAGSASVYPAASPSSAVAGGEVGQA